MRIVILFGILPVLLLLPLAPRSQAFQSVGRWVEIAPCDSCSNCLCGSNTGWPRTEAIHLMLTHEGKLLFWKNSLNRGQGPGWNKAHYWDPVTGLDQVLPETDVPSVQPNFVGVKDMFCSGHVALGDGKILIVQGEDANAVGADHPSGHKTAWVFDPGAVTLTEVEDSVFRRWYGTPALLHDARVVVVSGAETPHPTPGERHDLAEDPEIYDRHLDVTYLEDCTVTGSAKGDWTRLTSATRDSMSAYAWLHVLPGPGSNVLMLGPGHDDNSTDRIVPTLDRLGDLDGASPSWTTGPLDVVRGGSYAMFAKDKILKSGGLPAGTDTTNLSAIELSEVITINAQTGAVQSVSSTGSMLEARHEHNLVVLPDGKVLAVGGMKSVDREGEAQTQCSEGVLTTEVWDPATGLWSPLAPMMHRDPPVPRMYHATALLMPDARVLVAGGECQDACPEGYNFEWCTTADYYEPIYLFEGFNNPIEDIDRPSSTNALKSVAYGESNLSFPVFEGLGAVSISHVSLTRPAAVSHSTNMNQRFVPLSFSETPGVGSDTLKVSTFPDAKMAPPGYYMLFMVNNLTRPSHADFVLFWELQDATVSHVVSTMPDDLFEIEVWWKTTAPTAVGDDELVLTPPAGVALNGTFSGCVSDDGLTHFRKYVGSCDSGRGVWSWHVESKRPRYASGPEKSVSASATRTFKITHCVSSP